MKKYLQVAVFSVLVMFNVCVIRRGYLSKSGLFRYHYPKGIALSSVPIATDYGVDSASLCVRNCLRNYNCSSVNYEDSNNFTCELLAEDRTMKESHDMLQRDGFVYLDTAGDELNMCYRRKSCYPCSCTSQGFTRLACNCSSFPSKVERHTVGNVRTLTINRNFANIFMVDAFDLGIFIHDAEPDPETLAWVHLHVGSIYKRLHVTNENILYSLATDGSVYKEANGVLQKISNGYCSYIDLTPTHIICVDGLKTLWTLAMETWAWRKLSNGPVKGIQIHRGMYYAIGVECKCIVKHEDIVATSEWKWSEVTTNPGSCVQFKINFNDVLYARFEDGYIYEWDADNTTWISLDIGPCNDFDVYHMIACVKSDLAVYSDWNYHLPKPNIHIPFRYFNKTDKSTPYTRGADKDRIVKVSLVDSDSASIALDQFGRGHVLHKTRATPLIIGNFEPLSRLSDPYNEMAFHLSLWLRITNLDFSEDSFINVFITMNEMGMKIGFKQTSRTEFMAGARIDGGSFQARDSSVTLAGFHHWTHIMVRWRGPASYLLELFINGTSAAQDTSKLLSSTVGTGPGSIECFGCYFSDFAVWYGYLTDSQILRLYQSGVANGNQGKSSVSARSCMELIQEAPYETSGYYWINLNGNKMAVFCDMVTDGGGWTEITRLNAAKLSNFYSTTSTDHIKDTYKETYLLHGAGLRSLRNHMNYKQIRIFCTAPDLHSRTVDIATIGTEVVDFLTEVTSEPLPHACKTLYRTENDNSTMGANCESIGEMQIGVKDARLYNGAFEMDGAIFRQYGPVFACDTTATTSNGFFQLFVR